MRRNQYLAKKRRRLHLWPILCVLVLAGYVSYALLRPLSLIQAVAPKATFSVDTPTAALTWPAAQAAVALPGTNILTTHGTQTPVAIASTAKVITALTVLSKKPLKSGEQGPVITLTDADVALYNNYVAQDGSIVPVSVGEQISQYQMLEAIMLPSANNIADTMAIWAFGSLQAYAKAANSFVASHGMPNTHVGDDASGLSPTTTSTAHDLARLGALAMESPVLTEIVAKPSTTNIPLTGDVKNVNFLLGNSGIVGVKTGNTDQAGGVFISASRVDIAGRSTTIVTSVAGSANLGAALKESLALVQSAQKNFGPVTLVRKGDVVARYNRPWSSNIAAVASKDLTVIAWRGATVKAQAQLSDLNPQQSRSGTIGLISAKSLNGLAESIDVRLEQPSSPPTVLQRLTHPR